MPPVVEPGAGPAPAATPTLSIPEIRDYTRINAELVALLDRGHRRVRLEGAEGQRLLVAGLAGAWIAVVEVEGRTGPELASGLDAPGLVVVARGSTADGLALGLRSGVVVVVGEAGDSAGYAQAGGLVVVAGAVGHRAGLNQSGGTFAAMASTGRLPGERQSGGYFFAGGLGPHPGRGRSGGHLVDLAAGMPADEGVARAWAEAEATARAFGGIGGD